MNYSWRNSEIQVSTESLSNLNLIGCSQNSKFCEERYKVNGSAPIQNAVSGKVNKYPGYSPGEHTSPSPDQDVGVVLTDMAELEHSMTFHNLCYEVRELSKCCVNTKKILNNVSGVMVPGINAIMGPTGGGKTTLLDILAQRKGTSGLTQKIAGTILLNGQHLPEDYKLITGYVVQEDILEGVLTVRENLHFSAAIRLRQKITRQERAKLVDRTIWQLGLTSCADTVVGTEFIRGVSGGERKRTVIGMELITDPKVLFMDEPTTGLDAHTAVSVIQTLQDWCLADNRLVIMSIHQPRYSIFKLFDTLTLLSLGRVVYQGRASYAVEYFSKMGYGLEERENPADFMLDIINDSLSAVATRRRSIRKVKPANKLDLIKKYKHSEEARLIKEQLDLVHSETGQRARRRCGNYISYHCKRIPYYITSFFLQIFVLSIRSTTANWRNPSSMVFQIGVMTGIALLVGVVYFQLGSMQFDNLGKNVSDRIGALFLIVLAQEFGVLSGFDLFISQRALFIHENGSGFYRVSSFFVSKIVTDVIPFRIIPLFLFSIIIYFLIGFQAAADKFFIFFFVLALGAIALSSTAFAISAIIKNRSIAIVVFSLFNVFSILFSGIAISLSAIPEFLAWIQYVSIYGYVVQSLAINEISGVFYNATPVNISGKLVCNPMLNGCFNGTMGLEEYEFRTDSAYIWISVGALVGISVCLWALTYILLRCAKKHK